MCDILIPLGGGSHWNNNELRYCLRSVEKHLKGYGNVFIVGEKPEWLQNVIHIPFKDLPGHGNRDFNIYSKIMAGCNDERLSFEFLFMSDDHFLMADFTAARFPYYHRGDLSQSIAGLKNSPYIHVLKNTERLLAKSGYPTTDFNIHCPVVYDKSSFTGVFDLDTWPRYGFAIKSVYCNIFEIAGEPYTDLKFSQPLAKESIYQTLEGRLFFSIGNRCLKGDMPAVLEGLYPLKSKYEN